jgi:hypothetical protein
MGIQCSRAGRKASKAARVRAGLTEKAVRNKKKKKMTWYVQYIELEVQY